MKAVDFEPGFLGQLGMYMAAVDDLLAHQGDKPTIGLLLCRSKNNVVAEYALRGYSTPIGVAEWTTAITTALPEEFTSSLPSIEELEVNCPSYRRTTRASHHRGNDMSTTMRTTAGCPRKNGNTWRWTR